MPPPPFTSAFFLDGGNRGCRPDRHRPAAAVVLLACLAALAQPAEAGGRSVREQWFVGRVAGEAVLQMHARLVRRADGSGTDAVESTMLLVRTVGDRTVRLEMRDKDTWEVDRDGLVRSFRLDHEEDNAAVTATGRVEGGEVTATLMRLGRREQVRLALPDGLPLLGWRAGQERLAARTWKPGERDAAVQVLLAGGRLLADRSTSTFLRDDGRDRLVFEVRSDLVPLPMTAILTRAGELAGMTMDLGFFRIDVEPSPGPVRLAGAPVDAGGLVVAAGPPPGNGPACRYRLPAGVRVAADEFQVQEGEVVTVVAEARPGALPDPAPFLAKEAQLETDAPELVAWVARVLADAPPAERPELLRQAVRTRLRTDLGQADVSALGAFRSGRGDCSEHANLLCAALRIAGIPARTETGLVHSPVHGGWVGHAWACAHDGARWRLLDSAYPGIPRSHYIAFAPTSGQDAAGQLATRITVVALLAGKAVETLPE